MPGFTFKRNYTAEELVSKNPVLKDGLTVIDPTTQGLKIGDGVTRWADLSYVSSGSDDNGTSGLPIVNAASNLNTARPTVAGAVYWHFAAGTNVGVNGTNVVHALPGDLIYVADA